MSNQRATRTTTDAAMAGIAIAASTVLVLAGGLGSRLRPVVGGLPKVLAPVAGRPFLHYLLDYLRDQGACDILLSTGYGAEQVAASCHDEASWDVRLRYSRETELLGTGGAIKHAEAAIGSDPFLVTNGDSLVRADLSRLLAFHAARDARITIALVEVPDKDRFGAVRLAGDGAITAFDEKGAGGLGLINAGIYVFDRAVLASIPTGRAVSVEREVFPRFVGAGLYGLTVPGPFIDIGTPESYLTAPTIVGGQGANRR